MAEVDPRIVEGMAALANRRTALLNSGDRQVGWKVGFGSPSGLALLGIDAPLIGVLAASGDWSEEPRVGFAAEPGPVVECEIAAIMGRDVPPDVSVDAVGTYVDAWAPAFEFAAIDAPPTDVVAVLAGNIFHRGYRVGEAISGPTLAEIASRSATVEMDGVSTEVVNLTALTGDLADVLVRTASLAPLAGRPLSAGDIVLTGSIVAPMPVCGGSRVAYRLEGFDPLSTVIA